MSRAAEMLGWSPQHWLEAVLPAIIAGLKREPKAWYEANKVDWPD